MTVAIMFVLSSALNVLLISIVYTDKAELQAKIIVLHHQLLISTRNLKKPILFKRDKLLVVLFYLLFKNNDWQSDILIVKPKTVIKWHRQGFRQAVTELI